MSTKLLFILRDSAAPTQDYLTTATSGVAISTKLIAEALRDRGLDVVIVGVSIPEEIPYVVGKHQPTDVIVETLWVDPKYFPGFRKEFPNVLWSVREHSESCFRVYEPHAFGWIVDYMKYGIEVISNSTRSVDDVNALAQASGVDQALSSWGPNIYPIPPIENMVSHKKVSDVANIGCFGAVRPMKNHITQAIAAIMFGNESNKTVHFHINSYDIPDYIDPVINNLREMFSTFRRHRLVEHGWMCRADFLSLLRDMDIVSQVSFTETFNIVAADAMYQGVPLVTSDEVSWLGDYAHCDPNSSVSISRLYRKIYTEWCHRHKRLKDQRFDMEVFSTMALNTWMSRYE